MQTFLRLCQASLHVIEAAGKYPMIEARIQRVLANFYQLRAELLNLTLVTASPQGGHRGRFRRFRYNRSNVKIPLVATQGRGHAGNESSHQQG